jgi:hypothetical protein
LHASRNNPGWLIRRALRIGLVKGFIVHEMSPSQAKSMKWVLLGSGYATGNLLLALITLPLGPSISFRFWVRATRGCGIAVGTLFPNRILGTREYSVVHGS